MYEFASSDVEKALLIGSGFLTSIYSLEDFVSVRIVRCDPENLLAHVRDGNGICVKGNVYLDSHCTKSRYHIPSLICAVIELGDLDEHVAILNLAGGSVPITAESSVGLMRKAYLKLSLVLHPDR